MMWRSRRCMLGAEVCLLQLLCGGKVRSSAVMQQPLMGSGRCGRGRSHCLGALLASTVFRSVI